MRTNRRTVKQALSLPCLNGVKDDNRPENLELWTRPQPVGIRASDAVAWAREILARYEGREQTLNGAQPSS